MGFYLDASAILPILIDEHGSLAVDAFIAAAKEPLVVSEFAAAEVASALSRLVRTGLINPEDAVVRLSDFDAWRAGAAIEMDFQASDIRLAQVYVRRFDLMLRTPDALHVAACQTRNARQTACRRSKSTRRRGFSVSGLALPGNSAT